jgi:hypothetical protein
MNQNVWKFPRGNGMLGLWCLKSEHVITPEKNHIPWNNNHIPPPRMPIEFSCQSYRSLTGTNQRHSERITCRRLLQWFLNFWDNVPMDLSGIWLLFHGIWFFSGVITCSDFYPLSNQINLVMVINIWGIINCFVSLNKSDASYSPRTMPSWNMILLGE